MSEESTKGKVPTIPPDAVITIEVGGGLYSRFYQLMWDKAYERPAEKFKESLDFLKGGGAPRDKYEYELETYLSLLYEIETSAKKQGKLSYVNPDDIKT